MRKIMKDANKITYLWIKKSLIFLTILLLTLFAGAPGVLRLVYRADAQVALGHAKSVRMAIQVTGTEQYSKGKSFCDATQEGGVPEALYQKILGIPGRDNDLYKESAGRNRRQIR